MLIAPARGITPLSINRKDEDSSSSIPSAIATIGAVGGISALTMIGCFRVNEKNEVVMRDCGEALSFVQNLTELLRALGE